MLREFKIVGYEGSEQEEREPGGSPSFWEEGHFAVIVQLDQLTLKEIRDNNVKLWL